MMETKGRSAGYPDAGYDGHLEGKRYARPATRHLDQTATLG